MSSLATAAKSIFGAVQASMNMVTSTFNAANETIAMADRYIASASTDQRKRITYHTVAYEHRLKANTVLEETKTNKEIKDFREADPVNAEMFDAAWKRISEAVEALESGNKAATT